MPDCTPLTIGQNVVVRLPAELGIESAAELQRQLAGQLDQTEPVVLDASEVARVHTAALQLFCLFCRDRSSGGRQTHWKAPSTALKSAAALLGVAASMNLAKEVH